MIRSRLENLARAQKRQRLEDFSINQTSSSHQSNLENNENQVNVSSESDNADSDSESNADSDSLLELLKRNKRWQVDGTFACAPSKWVQNFTVAAEINKKIVVCAQALFCVFLLCVFD